MLGGLNRLPGSPQIHRWADWAELSCLASASGELSQADLAATVKSRNDTRHVEQDDDSELAEKETLTGQTESELSDRQRARIAEAYVYLTKRAEAFNDAYPFSLDNGRLLLRDETPARAVYLFLLHCAGLRYVAGGADRTSLTSQFEGLSLAALRAITPPSAEVHLFGKNAELPNGRYAGRLATKLALLCDDLGERKLFDEATLEANDFGDNGLDVVAWVPLGDPLNGRPVYFGQCACTPEWVAKQHSSSGSAFNMVMSQMHEPVNLCFVPYDFRQADGSWYKPMSIQRSVVLDRRRILSLTRVLENGAVDDAAADDLGAFLDFASLRVSRALDLQDL